MASTAGSMVTQVALPVLVYQLTGANLWTGFVAVAQALPYVCFGLLAGALADRFDRRRLMVGTDVASAAVLATIPLAYALGRLTAVHVLVAAFVAQGLFVFFDAANFGALSTLAGRDRLATANSVVSGGGTAVEVTVPAAAGALLLVVAPAPLISLDVVSFVSSALLVRAILRPLHTADNCGLRRLGPDIGEGLRFLAGHRLVRTLTLLATANNVAVAAFMCQLVPWMDQVLGVHPRGDIRFGLMWTVMGLGGLAGSVAFVVMARRLGRGRIALVGLPAAVLCVVICGLYDNWLVGASAVGAWYLADMVVVLTTITVRQRSTPDRLQGRVNTTARMLVWGLGWPAGALLGGLLSQGYGPRAAIWACAAVLATTSVAAWLSPLRTAARADQGGADQSGADQSGADQSGADQSGADQSGWA
jgi:MFS family permease